ncbi:hypothetical protein AC579_9572 [Pseudocercospora musae]|uniref:Uncharacterized protein n=1 Tax=Pseudocercospora musae TaxID=113226 RepID=A0A139IID9_9PEZI|nr:hypothetical protein AC579_9572 [Pseudocercospora musae]
MINQQVGAARAAETGFIARLHSGRLHLHPLSTLRLQPLWVIANTKDVSQNKRSSGHPLESSRLSKLRSFKDTSAVNTSATNRNLHGNHPDRSYNSRKRGRNPPWDDGLKHIEFAMTKSKQKDAESMDDGRIHVFTAMEQEVEKRKQIQQGEQSFCGSISSEYVDDNQCSKTASCFGYT